MRFSVKITKLSKVLLANLRLIKTKDLKNYCSIKNDETLFEVVCIRNSVISKVATILVF